MSATNGRVEAADILSPRDALIAAAEAGKEAIGKLEAANDTERNDVYRTFLGMAAELAQVAEGLSVYAATVGRWAAR